MVLFKKTALVCLFLIIIKLVSAQELQTPVNIQSPNASSLGKYGDVPVSYYTGTPNIAIPIYQTEIHGIPLDISLSYDASGIRLDNHPGWVGQNWSLNAGGVITRTVGGLPDEFGNANQNRVSYMQQIPQEHEGSINNYPVHTSMGLKELADDRVSTDYEPDIFTFNFLGISGKFFLSNDNEWKVISEHNLEIIFEPSLIDNYTTPFIDKIPYPTDAFFDLVIYGFKLRDDQGNIYTFGYNEESIEYSIPYWNQIYYSPYQNPVDISQWIANSWYLTKVEDKFSNVIYEFTYERGYFVASFFKSNTSTEKKCRVASGWNLGSYHWLASDSHVSNAYSVTGSLISPVYLKQISSFLGHEINFEKTISTEKEYQKDVHMQNDYGKLLGVYDGNSPYYPLHFLQSDNEWTYGGDVNNPLKGLKWFKLDEIEVKKRNELIKHCSLNYNNIATERLNLLGATFHAGITGNQYSYSFNYNDFDLLPGYLAEQVDHWGYNRGAKNVISGSISDFDKFSQHFNTRIPDDEALQLGVLKSIKYPTGGSTSFEFEAHDYSKIVNDERNDFYSETGIAGGMRIKKISDFDGENTITRDFKYTNDYVSTGTESSGILSFKPKYYWKDWKTTTNYDEDYVESIFSTNAIIPLANYFGSHIGYSEVIEVRNDDSFTVYKFTSNEDYMDAGPFGNMNIDISPYQKFDDRSFMRGKLKEKLEYDNSNALKRKSIFNYRHEFNAEAEYGIATDAMYGFSCAENNDQRFYRGSAWKIFFLDFDVLEEEVTLYQDGQSFVATTQYDKRDILRPSNNVRLTKKITTHNASEETITILQYPLDFIYLSEMESLIDANRLGEVVRSTTRRNDEPAGIRLTEYKTENSFYVPSTVKVSSTDEDNLYTQLYYDKYDEQGNVLEYHSADGIPVSVVWSYGSKVPTVVVNGATYDEVVQAFERIPYDISNVNHGFQLGDVDFRAKINLLREELPGREITSYTHNHYGITSKVDPNGQTVFYEYDEFGRLKLIKDFEGNIVKSYTYRFK